LVFSFFTYCNGQAQQPGHPRLVKTQDANEYQTISCGLQDKAGNLWFGTSAEGVYRFDGKLFTQFTVKEGLVSNSVTSILEDNTGIIWLGTREGLCRYDGKNITPFPITKSFMSPYGSNNYTDDQSTKKAIWSMLQDKSGKIWLGAGDGLYIYSANRFSRFLDDPYVVNKGSLKLSMVFSILEDKKGNMWFGSGMPPGEEGICRYDGKTLEGFKPKNEGWFRMIIEDTSGDLLFATRHRGVLSCDLSVPDLSVALFVPFPQPKELLNNSLTAILKDRAGNIWIASDYGKYVGDTLGGVWCYKRSHGAGEKEFTKITDQQVSFMLQDKDNNIWLGTRGTGLYRYDGKALVRFSE